MATHPANEALSEKEFKQIRELVYRTCGINLNHEKRQMVEARIGKKIREGGFGAFRDYYDHVVADRSGEELICLLNALSTNFTSFLREPAHFEFLRKTILPHLEGPIRIWCAACSSGEEPFSIAFSLIEELGIEAAARRASILATDISTQALAAAARAAYPGERFQSFPPAWLPKYLLRGAGRWQGWFRVKPEVRRMVQFRRLNLIEPFGHVGSFQIIFCRNVMIYFDRRTQAGVVRRIGDCLDPGGYLLVGHSESLAGVEHAFQYVCPAVYRRPS